MTAASSGAKGAPTLRAAAVQMCSTPNVADNLEAAAQLIESAAAAGATLIALPENFAILGARETDKVGVMETDGSGPIQDFLAAAARRHRCTLIGGTVPLRSRDPQRIRAACLVYGPDGQRLARYDKMHLFDVELRDRDEVYRESATIEPGDELVVADTPAGRIGLAVCYDLRFPELFRQLGERGVDLLAVPAAFTESTGRAHWEVLLRARAIENLCYVIAPAQVGEHASGRRTHGHAMIINPWGEVLGELQGDGPGVATALVDNARCGALRSSFPALEHRRLTGGPGPA